MYNLSPQAKAIITTRVLDEPYEPETELLPSERKLIDDVFARKMREALQLDEAKAIIGRECSCDSSACGQSLFPGDDE